jgi:hypothetical protein
MPSVIPYPRTPHADPAPAQPHDPASAEPCSLTLARQVSLWPFGSRFVRLHLVVDPSLAAPGLGQLLLRAMQQEYFRSEARSQTSAARSMVLAAHYALQHRNRALLTPDRVTAAAACAVVRGTTAYVALAGDAAALAWDGERLHAHRAVAGQAARPLGAEGLPRISLWSAPLATRERLALLCGAVWDDEMPQRAEDILRGLAPAEAEAALLSEACGLGASGPVRVLVAEGTDVRPAPSPRRTAAAERRPAEPGPAPEPPAGASTSGPPVGRAVAVPSARRQRHAARPAPAAPRADDTPSRRRSLLALVPLTLVLVAATLGWMVGHPPARVVPGAEPRPGADAYLDQAEHTSDIPQARQLAFTALQVASETAADAPDSDLMARAASLLRRIDRVQDSRGALLAGLGPRSADIADIAVDGRSLYTLDVADGAIRRYRADLEGQDPAGAPVVLRQGTVVDGQPIDTPIAMASVPGAPDGRSGPGALAVIDRHRDVVYLRADGSVVRRPLVGTSWQRLSAFGAAHDGSLYVVDGDSGTLVVYPGASQGTNLAARQMLSRLTTPGLPFEHTVAVVPGTDLYLAADDGSVHRFDTSGHPLPFGVELPDGPLGPVSGVVSDGHDGLYLADPDGERVVQATRDGQFLRQIRCPGANLATLRTLQISPDGSALYGITREGVMVLHLPPTPENS